MLEMDENKIIRAYIEGYLDWLWHKSYVKSMGEVKHQSFIINIKIIV